MKNKNAVDPNFESASRVWMDLPNIWTPVGWKDHLFRFNVLWNGGLFAQPCLNRRTTSWSDQGMQLTFTPALAVKPGPRWPAFESQDDGLVRQGWQDGDTPVLWSEHSRDGFLLRWEVFAHIPGGRAVRTGIEPLFAWVRLSVRDAIHALPLEKEAGFIISINTPSLYWTMDRGRHALFFKPYPRVLRPHAPQYSVREGLRLEEGGRVRLAVAPHQDCRVEFFPRKKGGHEDMLFIRMPARVGAHVDLLAPMLPTEPSVFRAECALGRDRALREANAFWRQRPATAATFRVPEAPINEAIRHSVKFAEVVAEKNPATGDYSMLTGGLCYADLWTTPHSMACIMTLDALGYHSVVEKYLEIFRKEQGTVVPPGDRFTLHPGYLSSPKSLTSIDWLSDHGALLYTMCEHALLSGNRKFIERWTGTIVKACEFIRDARLITGHGGVKGILPPAVATDRGTKIQAIWSDGWNYKGLVTAVRLLSLIGHERAEEFAAEAADYRRTFRAAFRRKSAVMPIWTDSRGRQRPFTPTALFGDQPDESRHAFYLDVGPLFLVYADLMDAADPLMRSTLLWFREGPQTVFFRRESNCFQVPCLDYEMSSCEPCYSWNVFHSHQAGDRAAYLTGMYSLFAGALSRKTYTLCESRGGISGLTPAGLPIWLARLAVIDDQLAVGDLHLLRFLPQAWCRAGQQSVFKDMPTEFGPVSLRISRSRDGNTLDVSFKSAFRRAPGKVILHAPPLAGLRLIRVNGRTISFKNEQAILPRQ